MGGDEVARTISKWLAAFLVILLMAAPLAGSTVRASDEASQSPRNPQLYPRDQIIDVRIEMEPSDWQALIKNAREEEDYLCNISYNGYQVKSVAVRAKGNSSLNSVAGSNSTRFSLKLDLDEFVKGQNLFGATVINLNNGFSDPTYMRELLGYEAFRSLGVPTPDATFANLYINGQFHGLYLAVEQVELNFLAKRFAYPRGDLYKPDGQGSDLKWYGDDFSAYSGMVYKSKDKTTSHQALLHMLDVLNHGGEYEDVLDVSEVLKYLAVSTVLSNFDSYQGQLKHNYYLYEQNGTFSVIPWDLNMAFAGFNMGANTQGMTSVPLDEPVTGELAERPLIEKLLAVPEYKKLYHSYVEQLVSGYLDPTRFAQRVAEVERLIGAQVQADPTKFYSYEDHVTSLTTDLAPSASSQAGGGGGAPRGGGMGSPPGLVTFVQQRVDNVVKQLAGELPTVGRWAGSSGAPGAGGDRPVGMNPPQGFDPPAGMNRPAGDDPQGQPPGNDRRQGQQRPADGEQRAPFGQAAPPGQGGPDLNRPGAASASAANITLTTAVSSALLLLVTIWAWRLRRV